MSQATQIRVPARQGDQVRTHHEQVKFDREKALDYDHYYVMLRNEATQVMERARTPVYYLDEERRKILDENGKPKVRSVWDVTLDVWAAWGADEYEFLHTDRGSLVLVTPEGLMGHIQAVESAKAAGIYTGDD